MVSSSMDEHPRTNQSKKHQHQFSLVINNKILNSQTLQEGDFSNENNDTASSRRRKIDFNKLSQVIDSAEIPQCEQFSMVVKSSTDQEFEVPRIRITVSHMDYQTAMQMQEDNTTKNIKEKQKNSVFNKKLLFERGNFQFIPESSKNLDLINNTPTLTRLKAIKLINGMIYEGEWLKGKPNGKGKCLFSDQSIYKGEGLAQGIGEYKTGDGEVYKGDFVQNYAHGFGIYQFKNGSKYEGYWEHNVWHGQGRLNNSDGSFYIGTFAHGFKSGKGIMHFSDGSTYEGHFACDSMNGLGKFIWLDQKVYNGRWLDGKMHGQGVLEYPDGRLFVGEYKNDKKDGHGTFKFPDGRSYCGGWKNGVQHGEGEFTDQQGRVKKGVWENGKIINYL